MEKKEPEESLFRMISVNGFKDVETMCKFYEFVGESTKRYYQEFERRRREQIDARNYWRRKLTRV